MSHETGSKMFLVRRTSKNIRIFNTFLVGPRTFLYSFRNKIYILHISEWCAMGFSNNRYYTYTSKHICYCTQLNMVQLWDRISLWSRPITSMDHDKKIFWWSNLKIVIRWKLRWLVCTSTEFFIFLLCYWW